MITKFAQRLFSAQDEQEDVVLNQIENDINIAKEDGIVNTEEYLITADKDGNISVFDKVNEEITLIKEEGDEFVLSGISEVQDNIPLNSEVSFDDGSGVVKVGTLLKVDGEDATVLVDGTELVVDYAILNPGDKLFSASASKDIVVLRVGEYDVEINNRRKTAKLLDEDFDEEFKVNINQPMVSLIKDLKGQIDRITKSKNFSKMSPKVQKYLANARKTKNFSRMSDSVRKHFLK